MKIDRRLEKLTRQAAAKPPPSTPIAAARLEKLHQEIALLQHKVRAADLERRALEKELMYQSEAAELLVAALSPVADALRVLPKGLAPRLTGQSLQAIEDTLTESVNRILKLGSHGIETFKQKTTSREL
jgi:septal ring factor EnvC (AmiA/AmiB activator)